jgi:hypothetical protein
MIDKTFSELESKIQASGLDAGKQQELLGLITRLKSEIGEHQRQNLTPLKSPVEDLRSSVEGFEQSHPKLVQAVNKVTQTLADLGI